VACGLQPNSRVSRSRIRQNSGLGAGFARIRESAPRNPGSRTTSATARRKLRNGTCLSSLDRGRPIIGGNAGPVGTIVRTGRAVSWLDGSPGRRRQDVRVPRRRAAGGRHLVHGPGETRTDQARQRPAATVGPDGPPPSPLASSPPAARRCTTSRKASRTTRSPQHSRESRRRSAVKKRSRAVSARIAVPRSEGSCS